MLPFNTFLLSMQAAGMISGLWDTRNRQKLVAQGAKMDKAALDANLSALNYEYEQSSLQSMKDLRQNLGTQMAINAVRGTASGQGTAAVAQQQSVGAFNQDERTRRLNLLSKEANLRASNVLSGLHTLESETQLGRQALKTLDSFSASSAFNDFRRSPLGKRWGFGLEPVE